MKKRLTILLLLFCLIVICFLFWYCHPRFITQSADHLQSITITSAPDVPSEKQTLCLTDHAEMEQLYAILEKTSDFHLNKYPNDDDMQHDPAFTICFSYLDGTQDWFVPAANASYIARYFDPPHPNGGYLLGQNNHLEMYLQQLSY